MTALIWKDEFLNNETFDSYVGGKALGFKKIKDLASWIPNFVILSSSYITQLRTLTPEDIYKNIYVLIKSEGLIQKLLFTAGKKIIIRSSAENEALENRGEYQSLTSSTEIEDIARTITSLISDWFQSPNSNLLLSLIIQEYIFTEAKGHLSNERRVSQHSRYWLVDYEESSKKINLINDKFPIFKNRLDSENINFPSFLYASDLKEITQALHRPAEYIVLFDNEKRIHFEWVWDGKIVWIVQADEEVPCTGKKPHDFTLGYEVKKTNLDTTINFEVLKSVNELNDERFNKTIHQIKFSRAGLVTTKLWYCLASQIMKNNKFNSLMKKDIEKLFSFGPIIIRTDLSCVDFKHQKDRQNLPRSSTLRSLDGIFSFISQTIKGFLAKKFNLDSICFIFHNYIPSLASAFSYADPKNPKIRIDSIWGLPDGLQYYSHDSFEVNSKTGKTINTKLRHKGFMLGATTEGNWIHTEVGVPFDWRESISEENRTAIAQETLKLATFMDKPVQIMWFIETPDSSTHPKNIPWYIEEREIENFKLDDKNSIYSRNLIKITSFEDINQAINKFNSNESYDSILLYPNDKIIRDNHFLKAVADLSLKHNKNIVFSGSILQHAFYQLRNFGAVVTCFDPFTPKEEFLEYNKLVRDKIPEIIACDGELPEYKESNLNEHVSRLLDKVIEESTEVAMAENKQERIEEIADVFEVIEAICELEEISLKDILKIKREKKLRIGGFSKGYFLINSKSIPAIKAEKPFSKFNNKKKSTNQKKSLKFIQLNLFKNDP